MQYFGQRLRFYRKEKGLTQDELADAINEIDCDSNFNVATSIKKDRIGHIERGRLEPTLSEILAFCHILDVSTDCLIHNVCAETREVLIHDIQDICKDMSDEKLDKFLEFMAVQADFVNTHLKCIR